MSACRRERGCGENPCVCETPASEYPAAKPYPKSAQLARGERRYRRKVASPKQWQAIIAAKTAPCRLCAHGAAPGNGGFAYRAEPIEFHHVVPRDLGGDDVADNIVALCEAHHRRVTDLRPDSLRRLAESLTDAEYAYVVGKLGEDGPTRLFGVGRG